MSIIQGTAKATAGDDSFYSFPIDQSLRFDGSSYLSRTVSNNNGTTYTFSVWLKRHYTTGGSVLTAGNVTSTIHYHYFGFGEVMSNIHYPDASGGMWLNSAAEFRDSSAWYHAVWVVDCTNSTTADRQKLYVNGERLTDFVTSTFAPSTSATAGYINSTYSENRIGRAPTGHSTYYAGYMAEINLLDGYVPTTGNSGIDSSGNLQVLGETKNGVWVPKDPSGLTYGTNGFRLTFENGIETIGGVANQIRDESSNSNHWTKN